MTVSTEISSNEYTGNGVTTDFDYKFRIFKANQLSVITSDADGDNVVTLRLGTDYTVTNANKAAGGKVILTKPLANGHKISIARDIPIKQETSFRNQSKFFAETHEDAFDYLTMILQRIWGSLGSLYLKRPNILANWFDAKGYRIANLGKPKRYSDAVDLGTLKDEIEGVNSTISKKEKRTLRVDDMDIAALPNASERAGNVLTFDKDGKPIAVAPASGSAIDVLNLLASEKGSSLIGTRLGENLEKYLQNLPCDIIVFTEQDAISAFTIHDHVLLRVERIDGTIEIPAYKTLTVLPPIGQKRNLLGGTGKKFILNRSSQFYAPSLVCLDYEMDVVTIKGSTRPAMILGVGRPVVANFTIESEYRKGRGLVLDASTGSNNKSGIIAGIQVNASIKGMDTAYEEIASRNGTESDATYINNNDINLTIWQCRRGLIQQEYVHGTINRLEVAANNYFINYQTDSQSEDVIHIYGVRNTVDGHVWDYEYPKLNSTSILVKGHSNVVGSRNFPSIANQFVTVDNFVNSRNTYIGGTYGTDRQDIGQFTLLHRPYHFSDLTTPITMTSSLFFLKSERVISSGNAVSIASRKLFYRSKDKLPLSLTGFAFVRNTSGSEANVRLGFGLSNIQGENSLSQSYTIANGGLVKIPITVLLTSTTLYIESGSTEWLGTPALSDSNGEITLVLSMTNNVQVTLCGCSFALNKFDY